MSRFREKMAVFMQGRYGMDQLGKVLTYATLFLLGTSMIMQQNLFYIIGIIGIGISYYRMFSRNIEKRYQENQLYLNWRYKMVCKISKLKKSLNDRRIYRIFNCPNCQQKIRIPKGKGRISIKCPKCRIEFVKKT